MHRPAQIASRLLLLLLAGQAHRRQLFVGELGQPRRHGLLGDLWGLGLRHPGSPSGLAGRNHDGTVGPASSDFNNPDQPLDQGVFNARVPLTFFGEAPKFVVPFNAFETVTLRTVDTGSPNLRVPIMEMHAGATFYKPVHLDPGTLLGLQDDPSVNLSDPRNVDNVYVVAATSGIEGPGQVYVRESSLVLNADVNVNWFTFGGGRSPTLYATPPSVVSGPGNISVSALASWEVPDQWIPDLLSSSRVRLGGDFDWFGGHIAGPGMVTVGPAAILDVRFSSDPAAAMHFSTLDGTTFVNQGQGTLEDTFVLGGGALFRNEGTFTQDPSDILPGAGGGRVENAGSYRFEPQPFNVETIQVPFLNRGQLRIEAASTTGVRFASLENAGFLSMAPEPGRFSNEDKKVQVLGDFVQRDSGTFHLEITYDPYSLEQSGHVFIDGQAVLAGTLEVDYVQVPFLSPPAPPLGGIYPVLIFGSRSGDFTQFIDLDPDDSVGFARVFDAATLQLVAQLDAPPLRAAGGANGGTPPSGSLTVEQIQGLFEAAIQRWAETGLFSDDAFRHLRQVTWQVADLGGDRLAKAVGDTITLDDDAAGYRWFIDPTPSQNEEFTPTAVDHVFAALAAGPAVDRMDLLSAMLHEMGHELGLKDLDPAASEGVMTALVGTGKRRVP